MENSRMILGKKKRPINEYQSRMVSFSKRKKALLNKAPELCLLCNPQLCCLIFSPTGKITVFGHSNADDILDHFLNKTVPPRRSVSREHQRMAQEYGKFKDRVKSMKKNQKDVAPELRQWVEDRFNSAQTLEELNDVINEFQLIKEKLEARLKNLQSSVGEDFHSTVSLQLSIIPPEDIAPRFVLPPQASSGLEDDNGNGTMNNLNIELVL